MNRNKLELTWIGKENRPKLEPRILLEDPEKSYHAPHRITDHDIFDNRQELRSGAWCLSFGENIIGHA
jgi:adenine-specific DNA-methyltransferase